MTVSIIHIVKRLGRVGGMETYVWHLIHGLAQHGETVAVVCEDVFESPAKKIKVIQVSPSLERRRWKSMLCFRERVQQVIKREFKGKRVILHSHERSLGHQVTTFHGPPIDIPSRWSVLGWLNPRLRAWRAMERDELLCKTVKIILPVSAMIEHALKSRYNFTIEQCVELAWPGVEEDAVPSILPSPHLGPVQFLFVGKEWKRKGLRFAISVVNEFRRTHADAVLTVFGVVLDELPADITALEWVSFKGWDARIPWVQFDILIHPAIREPFGMVVAEARTQGLPVLMSTHVGAADLNFSLTEALPLDATLSDWCDAAQMLLRIGKSAEVKWSWSNLVAKHLNVIYPKVAAVKV